ncbi:MAG: ABC transporter ATP-binding protein [Clostridia bacterium]|nr:ABC transporter ATP-binding protein [Clostridia bacterium]
MSKLKRFLGYYKPHKKMLVLDLSCASAISLVDLGYPLLTQYILRTLMPEMKLDNSLLSVFFMLLVFALLAYLIRTVMQYVVNYWGHLLGVRMEADMRRDIFAHIQTLPYSFYDRIRTGKLLSRVTTDLFDITELAHHGPEDVLISGMTIIGAFIAMFVIEWKLALAMLILLPCMLVFVMLTRFRMRMASRRVKETVAGINAGVESSISGARVAKAFTNEDYEIEKFERGNGAFLHAKDDFYRYMALFGSGTEFFIALFNILVLCVGGLLIFSDQLDPLVMITFTLYVSAFASPVKRLANFAEQYIMGMAGFVRFLEIMDTKPDIVDKPNAEPLSEVRGEVEFKNVSFSYDDGVPVLTNLRLNIPAGSTLALAGPSGGGKTTLCHLLMRFYEANEGQILIDGKSITEVTQKSLRRNIGIVQQDVFLFAGTVLENIRYGRLSATDEEVFEAAKRAHIHDEIMSFSDGYHTEVGERGVMLSGGQKQRISIARLFLKNPPVLILDEATSALDTLTEADIQHSFDELAKGRTTLIIAHRLSTVRNADKIVVIDEGVIKESGTHDELLQTNGVYASFYHATMRE